MWVAEAQTKTIHFATMQDPEDFCTGKLGAGCAVTRYAVCVHMHAACMYHSGLVSAVITCCRQLLQAVYLAAKRKSERLGECVEGYAVEATKLTERLVSAEAQYVDGMRKVKAASKQLQYLQKEVAGSEANAQSESCHKT